MTASWSEWTAKLIILYSSDTPPTESQRQAIPRSFEDRHGAGRAETTPLLYTYDRVVYHAEKTGVTAAP